MSVDLSRSLAIDGWMTEEELQWLAGKAKQSASVVEVGCYLGRTTRVLAENCPGHVYACDDWKGLREKWWEDQTPPEVRSTLFERFSANLDYLVKSGKVVVYRVDHGLIGNGWDITFRPDMVFIDGAHNYESVKRDIQAWLPRLNKGGIICGHDSHQQPVWQAVYELLPNAIRPVGNIWAVLP